MEDARRDQNFITGKMACLNTDTVQGTNLVRIQCEELTGAMKINETDTISFTMVPISPQDRNYVNCLTFVGTDGLTYPWVANASGEVLIDT